MSSLPRRVLIMGAAGRDFHDFATRYRDDPTTRVVAFTATQIPFIDQRVYPSELAGPRYPAGIPILPETELEELIGCLEIDEVAFAYSDIAHEELMHRASKVLAAGATFTLTGPNVTMLATTHPSIAVTATRTGAGKSPTSRQIAGILRAAGRTPIVVRHPMPYGDLLAQRAQLFRTLRDMDAAGITIEEREEYEPHVAEGTAVAAGVDTAAVLRLAEQHGDIIVFDGGNNDLPLIRPDLYLTVIDPHRAAHALSSHPGETNLRRADVILISKIDTASPAQLAATESIIAAANPDATVLRGALRVTADEPSLLTDARVLVIEDGPTTTHGGMRFGAGVVAAERAGAKEIIDPRPYTVGSIADACRYYDVGPVLPALGYAPSQLRELEMTIAAVPCDVIVVATPVDLRRLLDLSRPVVRVGYELEVVGSPTLEHVLAPFTYRSGSQR